MQSANFVRFKRSHKAWDCKHSSDHVAFSFIVPRLPHVMRTCLWWNMEPIWKMFVLNKCILLSDTWYNQWLVSCLCHMQWSSVHLELFFDMCITRPLFRLKVSFQRYLRFSHAQNILRREKNGVVIQKFPGSVTKTITVSATVFSFIESRAVTPKYLKSCNLKYLKCHLNRLKESDVRSANIVKVFYGHLVYRYTYDLAHWSEFICMYVCIHTFWILLCKPCIR